MNQSLNLNKFKKKINLVEHIKAQTHSVHIFKNILLCQALDEITIIFYVGRRKVSFSYFNLTQTYKITSSIKFWFFLFLLTSLIYFYFFLVCNIIHNL